jgi:hypothetical protein
MFDNGSAGSGIFTLYVHYESNGFGFSHGLSFEFESVTAMNNAIQYLISDELGR